MPIILVGLNHHTAPVELREQLALDGCGLTFALEDLPVHPAVFNGDPIYDDLPRIPPALSEAAILSTCNRLEVYAVTRDMAVGRAAVDNFLSRLQGLPPAARSCHGCSARSSGPGNRRGPRPASAATPPRSATRRRCWPKHNWAGWQALTCC